MSSIMLSCFAPLLLILSINAMSQSQIVGNITCDESVTGSIRIGAYEYWTLDLAQEYLVTFDDCSSTFDSTLSIFNSQHRDISSTTYCPSGNDCGKCSNANRSNGEIFTLPLPIGTYHVQMHPNGGRGDYEINIQCNKISPLDTIQCGSTKNGLVSIYDVHYYQWNVLETIPTVNINGCGITNFDPSLLILDENYNDIITDIYCTDNNMAIQNLSAGTYYIAISPFPNEIEREYQIELTCDDPTIQFLRTIRHDTLNSIENISTTTDIPTRDPTNAPTDAPTTAMPTFVPTNRPIFTTTLQLSVAVPSTPQNTTNISNDDMQHAGSAQNDQVKAKQSPLEKLGLNTEYVIFISLITAICCATACFMAGLIVKLKKDKLRKKVISCPDTDSLPKGHSPPWNNVYSIEITTTNADGDILTVPMSAVNNQSQSNHARSVNSVSTPISINSSQEIMNFDITQIQTNSTPIVNDTGNENEDLYGTFNTIQYQQSDDKYMRNNRNPLVNDEVRDHAYSYTMGPGVKHKLPSLPPESLAKLDNVLMDKNSVDVLQPIVEQDTFSASPPLPPKSAPDIKEAEPEHEPDAEMEAERNKSSSAIVGIPRQSQLLPPATPGDQFEDGDFEHYEGDGEDLDDDDNDDGDGDGNEAKVDPEVDEEEDILGPMPVIKNPMITIGNTPNGVSVESNDVEMEYLEKVFRNPDMSPSLLATKVTTMGPTTGGYGQSNDTDEEFDSNTHEL